MLNHRNEQNTDRRLDWIVQEARRCALKLCSRRGINPDTAEDIAQNTSLRVFSAAGKLRATEPVQIRSWLYKIAGNELNSLFNKKMSQELTVVDQAPDSDDPDLDKQLREYLFAPSEDETSPENAAIRQAHRELVWQVLNILPPNQRTVLVLFYFEGLSLAQIASHLDITPENGKTRLHRARGQFKAEWLRLNESPSDRTTLERTNERR